MMGSEIQNCIFKMGNLFDLCVSGCHTKLAEPDANQKDIAEEGDKVKNIEGPETKKEAESDEQRHSPTPDISEDNPATGDKHKESKEQTSRPNRDTNDVEAVLSSEPDKSTSDMEMECAGLDTLPVITSKQPGMFGESNKQNNLPLFLN